MFYIQSPFIPRLQIHRPQNFTAVSRKSKHKTSLKWTTNTCNLFATLLQNELESYARFTTHQPWSNLSGNKWGCSKLRDYWLLIWEGAEHSTFEGGMVDFRRKYPSNWFREGKKYFARKYLQHSRFLCQSYVRKKTSITKKFGEKILTQTKSSISALPQKSNGRPPKLRGSHAIHGPCVPQHIQILLQKMENYSLLSATTWFPARQLWLVGDKTRNSAIQLVLERCRKVRKASCMFFLALLTVVALPFPV